MAANEDSKDNGRLPYRYERGEGRTKHCWNRPEAGFVPGKRGAVGKCANTITDEVAQELLGSGLHVPHDMDNEDEWYPDEIFNTYQGVVYVAVPTRPGESYHGYPYKGRLTKRIYDALHAKAAKQNYQSEFEKWSKSHIDR